jgi:hypothetical protein
VLLSVVSCVSRVEGCPLRKNLKYETRYSDGSSPVGVKSLQKQSLDRAQSWIVSPTENNGEVSCVLIVKERAQSSLLKVTISKKHDRNTAQAKDQVSFLCTGNTGGYS